MKKDFPDPRQNSAQATSEEYVDRIAEFQKLSTGTPAPPGAELAFLESKLAMANADPHLSNQDRARIVGQLQDRIEALNRK